MGKHIIKGLVNGEEVNIAVADFMDSPPHEITIEAIKDLPENIMNVMVVGLQYYDFSMFSILIEVNDEDAVAHHFMIDSWEIQDDIVEPIYPLEADKPYLHFNEQVRKQLMKQ